MTKVVGLDGNIPKPKLNDLASWEKAQYSLGGKPAARYNPDTLVGRQGLQVYGKMRNDDQVKAVMQFKRDAITSRGWAFVYDEGSTLSEEERKKRIRVFTRMMQKVQGGFEDSLNAILTGRDYGFSMTETVMTKVSIDGTEYIGPHSFWTRDPVSFEFNTDEYGVLRETYQCSGGKKQEIDMSRFIHYVHAPEFDRYFGRSDLREAYRPWYIKERVGDFWALWLERFAGGFLVAKRTAESSMVVDSPEYRSLQAVIQNLHGSSGIIPPRGVEIELLFPSTTDAFEKAMVFWDLAIAKAILVPNLLGLSHTGQTGAFAQSQTQLRAFIWTCKSDAKRIQATLDDQLIKRIGDVNFGDGEYPSFVFNDMDIDFLQWLVTTWSTLTGKVVVSTEADENHLRKLLGMPERRPEDKPVIDPVVEGQENRASQGQEFDQEMRTRQEDRADKQSAADEKFAALTESLDKIAVQLDAMREQPPVNAPPKKRKPKKEDPLPEDDEEDDDLEEDDDEEEDLGRRLVPHGQLRSCTLEQFNRAAQRVFFSVIEKKQNDFAQVLTKDVAQQVARAVKRLLGTNEQLAKLTDDNVEDVASVELSSAEKSRLQTTYRRALTSSYTVGAEMARNELERAGDDTIAQSLSRRASFTSLRDKASQYFEVNSYRMAGNVSDATRAMIQQELQTSIRVGRSPEQTREVIWLRLLEKGLTVPNAVKEVEDASVMNALEELGVITEDAAAAYLDTLSRTNLFEAMNEARYAEFTSPDLDGFVAALQYSAILDDRTTDICQSLDNGIYDAESNVWDEYRPPNHYNCRSILVPVTQLDGWSGQESPPPSVTPQAGFGAGTK